MDMTVAVYRLTENYPRSETYGLRSQMRSCASSVPANIAEGRARRSQGEFRHFLHIAAGSVAELETFVELPRRLSLAPEQQVALVEASASEVGRMLYGMIRAVCRSIND
ncbi:MAG TPA: hypothetical protein DEP45_09450 [Armatimonadetes bacterium]|nr:hypothetical protein [Armatimonadota bacterium]